jgi:hypothetical protein
LPARSVTRKFFAGFAAEAGFIDLEGVADQRRWLVLDGSEIA